MTTDLTATSFVPATRVSPHRFSRGMGLVFLVTVIIGFSNSTHSRMVTGAPPLSPFVMLHAVLFVSWFVIFWVQSMLAHGRIRLHRGLGYAATVIATFITLDGPYTAVLAVRRGVFGDDGLAFMLVMIGVVTCNMLCVELRVRIGTSM